jgi:hypothetical protein
MHIGSIDFAAHIAAAPCRADRIVTDWTIPSHPKSKVAFSRERHVEKVAPVGKYAEFGPLEYWISDATRDRKQDPRILVLGADGPTAQSFRELAGGYLPGSNGGEGECYVIDASLSRIANARSTLVVPHTAAIVEKLAHGMEPTWYETKPSPFYTFIEGNPAELDGLGALNFDFIFINDVPPEQLSKAAIRATRHLTDKGAIIHMTDNPEHARTVEGALIDYRTNIDSERGRHFLFAYR